MEPYVEPYRSVESSWRARQRPAPRSARRWLLLGGIALAFALTLGVGIAIAATLQPIAQAATMTPGGVNIAQYPGIGQRPFAATPAAQGQCGVLTVTSVSGSTIVATSPDGGSVTIHTTASTQYTKAGQSATASAVAAGAQIHVDGTRNSDGSITATRIDVR
jgi:hypothetical protein